MVKHGGEALPSERAWNWTSIGSGGGGSCWHLEGGSRAKLPLTAFAQYEVSFNQPSSMGFQRVRLAAFNFRGVTYLGGLKNATDSSPRESFPAALGHVCRQNAHVGGLGEGKTEQVFMFSVWVERTSCEVCVNHISHLFDRP